MAQYPVPQFIEEEGKIVFFLTFRQFFLLIAGGVVSFILFITTPIFVFIPGAIAAIALVCIIAFVKIDGMPVIKFIVHFLGFTAQSKNYIWKKKGWAENESSSILELPQRSLDDLHKTIETKK